MVRTTPQPDLADHPYLINSRADFAGALNALLRGRPVSALWKWLEEHPNPKMGRIARATLYGYFEGTSRPASEDILQRLLQALSVNQDRWPMWTAAWRRAAEAARTITHWDPWRLGVHQALIVPADAGPVSLPTYVPRAHDRRIRARLAELTGPAMLVLIGDSSTGKTRACYEAVIEVLPGWPVERPTEASPAALIALLSGALPDPVVIWLDEIHTYFTGDAKELTAAVAAVEHALYQQRRIVLLGSTWLSYWTDLIRPADSYAPRSTVGVGAHWANLPAVIVEPITPDFSSPADLRALEHAAAHDAMLAEALRTAGTDRHVTQVLAGGPQQLAAYHIRGGSQDPADRAIWAVLTAAIDATRLGHLNPLSAEFLRTAAPGYLNERSRVLPNNWFDAAITSATKPIYGTYALTPLRTDIAPGAADSYRLHDYIQQNAGRQRQYEPTPDSLWDAIAAIPIAPNHRVDLAHAASLRGLFRHTHQLLTQVAETPPFYLTHSYTEALSKAPTAWIRQLSRAGDPSAIAELGNRPVSPESEILLHELMAGGNLVAEEGVAKIIAKRSDEEGLRELAAAGNSYAQDQLAKLITARGDEEGLRELAAAGNSYAQDQLAELIAARGDEEELRKLAAEENSSSMAEILLANLLAQRGDEDGLRELATARNRQAQSLLVHRAVRRGDEDGLRELMAAGDLNAPRALAILLAGRGDEDGLRVLAAAGNHYAQHRLPTLVAKRGDEDELRELMAAGYFMAQGELARLVAVRGGEDELRELAAAGNVVAVGALANMFAERGDAEKLRPLAEGGNWTALDRLTDSAAERGDLSVLRQLRNVGHPTATRRLLELAAQRHSAAIWLGLNDDGTDAERYWPSSA